jgi:hypothetical protein
MHCISKHCKCNPLCYLGNVAQRRRNLEPKATTKSLGNDSQLVVRLPAALVGRVDQFAERMRAELPGLRFARAEAVRVLLTRALDQSGAKAKA